MKRILFVEDEPRGVNPYFNRLERRGYQCVTANNGDEAVAKLQLEKFDLLSLDVMFNPGRALAGVKNPRHSGLHLLELLRGAKIPNCDPNLKVMVLTAIMNPGVEERIKALGVVEYFKKPVQFEKVIDMITSTLQDSEPRQDDGQNAAG